MSCTPIAVKYHQPQNRWVAWGEGFSVEADTKEHVLEPTMKRWRDGARYHVRMRPWVPSVL